MIKTRRLFFLCILLIASVFIPVTVHAAEDAAPLIEQGDAAWDRRGTGGDPDNQKALDFYLSAARVSPFNYEAHWKAARSIWWIADQLLMTSDDKNRQRDLGRQGMDIAGRAVLIMPDGVEGNLFWALSALHYGYGVGMVQTLKEGIEDEVLSRLLTCYTQDRTAQGGLVLLSLSAFYRTVPWPARDRDKSLVYAREALGMEHAGIRAMVFAAASLEARGLFDESKELLTKAAEAEGDKTLEPDYKRWKRFAETCLDKGRVITPERLF